MLSYQDALAQILEQAAPLPVKRLKLGSLQGHVLAQAVTAKFELPRFDNSAVDGYGVLTDDVSHASDANPAKLRLLGEMSAGSAAMFRLEPGTCVKILTGARVPASAESVVMREYCDAENGYVSVKCQAKPGENIRRKGAEFMPGQEILPAGVRITPPVVGLLATLGYSSFPVYSKPRVAFVITGDELVQPGHPLGDGQIYDSNSYALQAAVTALGIEEWSCYYARDTRKSTRQAFAQAIEEADVVISSGGVSVGDHDYVKEVLADLKVKTIFWRIAIKPGKPVYFGTIDIPRRKGARKLIFGLPGNPVSVLVTYHQFVKLALLKLMGSANPMARRYTAELTGSLAKKPGRLDFVRARLAATADGTLQTTPTRGQDSHMLSGLVFADCLLHFDANDEFQPEGAKILCDQLNWNE
jgi:molybdopterin molybdotransferase